MPSFLRGSSTTSRTAFVLLALLGLTAAGPRVVAAQVVPDEPPYCHAVSEDGSADPRDPLYCLARIVDTGYAPPVDGYDAHVGYMGKVTAFYPSNPVPDEYPTPPNYPHVVITYTPSGHGEYAHWPEHATGGSMAFLLGGGPSNNHSIELTRVLDCGPHDTTCDYEVRGTSGDIGNPPEWFRVEMNDDVQGNCEDECLYPYAQLYAGIGLVADGNQPPVVHLSPIPLTDLEYTAHISADDPDHDLVTGYVFDWGDGTVTSVQASNDAVHTYATAGNFSITGYAIDQRGAVGAQKVDLANYITVTADGPHTVAVGAHIDVTVTIKNQGLGVVDVKHNYGFESGGSPKSGVLKVTTPAVLQGQEGQGGSLVGTYRIDGLKDGHAIFAFGADSQQTACVSCQDHPVYVPFEVTVGNGDPGPTPTPVLTPTPVATHTPTLTPGHTPTPVPTQTPTPNGFVPPDADSAHCEVAIARGLGQLSDCTRSCNRTKAISALQRVPFDDDACQEAGPTSCRGVFDAAATAVTACPACLDGAAQADVADQVMDFIAQSNGAVYCRGKRHFGGDDTGLVPRNAAVASCEGSVAKALRKYAACLVQCDLKQARTLARGGSFDEDACKFSEPKSCRATYDASSANVLLAGGCPKCLDATAQAAAADDVTGFVAEMKSNTYCAGTIPLP